VWVRRGYIVHTVTIAVLLVTLALEAMGCKAQPAEWSELGAGGQQQHQSQQRRQGAIQIVPQPSREVADLNPDDVVRIMRRIGFTDDQILELGTDMHDALFNSGAARVVYKEETEALVSVKGMQVYVRSRSRGSFIYDLGYGQFVTPGANQ